MLVCSPLIEAKPTALAFEIEMTFSGATHLTGREKKETHARSTAHQQQQLVNKSIAYTTAN